MKGQHGADIAIDVQMALIDIQRLNFCFHAGPSQQVDAILYHAFGGILRLKQSRATLSVDLVPSLSVGRNRDDVCVFSVLMFGRHSTFSTNLHESALRFPRALAAPENQPISLSSMHDLLTLRHSPRYGD